MFYLPMLRSAGSAVFQMTGEINRVLCVDLELPFDDVEFLNRALERGLTPEQAYNDLLDTIYQMGYEAERCAEQCRSADELWFI